MAEDLALDGGDDRLVGEDQAAGSERGHDLFGHRDLMTAVALLGFGVLVADKGQGRSRQRLAPREIGLGQNVLRREARARKRRCTDRDLELDGATAGLGRRILDAADQLERDRPDGSIITSILLKKDPQKLSVLRVVSLMKKKFSKERNL